MFRILFNLTLSVAGGRGGGGCDWLIECSIDLKSCDLWLAGRVGWLIDLGLIDWLTDFYDNGVCRIALSWSGPAAPWEAVESGSEEGTTRDIPLLSGLLKKIMPLIWTPRFGVKYVTCYRRNRTRLASGGSTSPRRKLTSWLFSIREAKQLKPNFVVANRWIFCDLKCKIT